MSALFDINALIAHRTRAINQFDDYDFLIHRAWDDVISRIHDIKLTFDTTLIIGARGAESAVMTLGRSQKISSDVTVLDYISPPNVQARAYDQLPFPLQKYDLILSVFDLQTWTDVPGMLMQIRACLKPDGVCLLAFLGGETLFELKSAITKTEIALMGGLSPRVHPVIDLQQMAALMQRAGFALPVVDNTKITVEYRNITRLLHDIRGMGESNALMSRDKRIVPHGFWHSVEATYRAEHQNANGHLNATFDIIHAIGWAPAPSQPQPAKRGSGTVHLSTVLK